MDALVVINSYVILFNKLRIRKSIKTEILPALSTGDIFVDLAVTTM